MSLTQFIKIPEVGREILKVVKFPTVHLPQIQHPLSTNDPPKMGNAVDYGIRFFLHHKYGARHHQKLIAELASTAGGTELSNEHANQISSIVAHAKWVLENATKITDDYAYQCWQLANLDMIWRAGELPRNIPDQITKGEIREFKSIMFSAVSKWPAPEEYCLLNPQFGNGTMIMNGGDADIVQDNAIIDIKTVCKLEMTSLIKQLVGYAVLEQLDCVENKPNPGKLCTHLGVYAARHGHFEKWPIDEIISRDDLEGLAEFFNKKSLEIAYGPEALEE